MLVPGLTACEAHEGAWQISVAERERERERKKERYKDLSLISFLYILYRQEYVHFTSTLQRPHWLQRGCECEVRPLHSDFILLLFPVCIFSPAKLKSLKQSSTYAYRPHLRSTADVFRKKPLTFSYYEAKPIKML